ncbi:hypothetical protein JTB14_031829 [Gonioctena quinquepunctata]|nr:hypothetical protein JTB14_031829 [Gonioctena quinquepunctata]
MCGQQQIPPTCSRMMNLARNCDNPHKSNYGGCPYFSSFGTKEGTKEIPRQQQPRPRIHEINNPQIVENAHLVELCPALHELRDFFMIRLILTEIILIKNIQGLAESAEKSIHI